MQRITVSLNEDERKALQHLAQTERRHPRQQAAWLIRYALEQRGMLSAVTTDPETRQLVLEAGGRHEGN